MRCPKIDQIDFTYISVYLSKVFTVYLNVYVANHLGSHDTFLASSGQTEDGEEEGMEETILEQARISGGSLIRDRNACAFRG